MTGACALQVFTCRGLLSPFAVCRCSACGAVYEYADAARIGFVRCPTCGAEIAAVVTADTMTE